MANEGADSRGAAESGFYRRVFNLQAFIYICFGGIYGYGEKRALGESEILKILILTRAR